MMYGGQEREKRGSDPSTPSPPLTEIYAKGIFFPGKYHVLYCQVLGNFIKNFESCASYRVAFLVEDSVEEHRVLCQAGSVGTKQNQPVQTLILTSINNVHA